MNGQRVLNRATGGAVPPRIDEIDGTGDVLGVSPIPAAELRTAKRLGIPTDLLDAHFPLVNAHTALSRGAPYYNPDRTPSSSAALTDALRTLDRHTDTPLPALRRAVIDNLHNIYAAAAYERWEYLTDTTQPAPDEHQLDEILDTATLLSADLAGLAPSGWTLKHHPPELGAIRTIRPRRTFRELDNHTKIYNEVAFLLHHVIDPRPDITAIVVPLYGCLALGLAARAILPSARPDRHLPVHLVRLGFHDQAGIDFVNVDGSIRLERTAPPTHLHRLVADANHGHVLVVDDNAGYGSTLRATRTLITQLGGHATTRSVETAWHLYHRRGLHDIADAVDLPSLRPNLHHTIHQRLTTHLRRGDTAAYTHDPAHTVRATLHQQMAASYDLALSLGTWRTEQLNVMRTELAHANLARSEPSILLPTAQTPIPARSAA